MQYHSSVNILCKVLLCDVCDMYCCVPYTFITHHDFKYEDMD